MNAEEMLKELRRRMSGFVCGDVECRTYEAVFSLRTNPALVDMYMREMSDSGMVRGFVFGGSKVTFESPVPYEQLSGPWLECLQLEELKVLR